MAQLDYIVQAFTVFVDGFGKAGTGEKASLPKLKKKTEDFRGGGMLGTRKVAMGYEALTHSVSLSSFDPQVLAKAGLFAGNKSFAYSLRGYLDGDRNIEHTVIAQMRGEVTEFDPGEWDAGKKAMLKYTCELVAVKLQIDAVVVWDIDIENGLYAVNGADPYQAVGAALGR